MSDPARGDLLIHLGRVSDDNGRAGHEGLAPGTENRARGLSLRPRPVADGRAREGGDLVPELGCRRLEGGDVMSPAPSGNKRLDAPGQPVVVVDRRVRAPADHLAEAAVSRLLAGAPLQVRKAFCFQVHVHVRS